MEWIRGEEIGCGGFASIYLAIPKKNLPDLPPLMAVKSCDLSESATLRNELEILSRLGECHHVIRCFGDGRTVEGGSELYNLVLEYAPGGSLVNEMKRRGGKLPEPEVHRHTRSVLEALSHIHSRGFVHGDIKVQNILVFPPVNGCGTAEVKVCDFGLAKMAGSSRRTTDEDDDDEGGRGFEWRGTPLYMSPEAVNENECEAPSDVWALGCAVVEMATGRPAWDHPAGSNVYQLMIRIGVGDEIPIIPQHLSDEGKDFLGKCFVKDPAKRWTAEMLLNHPFVTGVNSCDFALPPRSPSPRSHFDFVDWDSFGQSSTVSVSPSPTACPWEIRQEHSELGSSGDSDSHRSYSLIERIQIFGSGEIPNWEDSEGCWFSVRLANR